MGARFSFTGKLVVNTKQDDKMYYLRTGKTKGDSPYKSINVQVAADKNNRAFVECFGMVSDTIKTMDTDNNKIDIAWEDRKDKDVMKSVANYKKFIIKIDEDRNEFISSYDAIECFIDNLDELNGKVVTVTGQRVKNLYKDKLSDRFQIASIYYTPDDETTNRLSVTADFFFNKDSFDLADWNEEHKLYINGWTEEYIGDVKDNRYVEQQIIFDCSKVDWENEKHIAMVNYRLKCLGCELGSNNKPVVKIKGKNVYKMGVILNYINGSEELEFDESMLTPMQKEAIELGLKKLEDFKPAGSTFGTRVVTYKLRDFNMRKDSPYEDGYIDTEITIDEFNEKVWVPAVAESLNEIDNAEDNLPFKDQKELAEDDEDDLFG